MDSYARSVCSCLWLCGSKTDNMKWGSLSHTHIHTRKQRFFEMWTKNFKRSPSEEGDVGWNDTRGGEILNEGSPPPSDAGESWNLGDPTRVDEDPFEKQMRLTIWGDVKPHVESLISWRSSSRAALLLSWKVQSAWWLEVWRQFHDSPASDGGGMWVAQVVTYVIRLLHWLMLEESIKVSSLYFSWICCWKIAWCLREEHLSCILRYGEDVENLESTTRQEAIRIVCFYWH
jgi:hypothetical protein